MIILFDDNETLFTGLGLGSLGDAKSCKVKETLNDAYEVELVYPINGNNYDKIKLNRIIYCKPNPYSDAQPFRITSISKPINGIVTIIAVHISYDMNGIIVGPIDGKTLSDTLDKIQNGSIRPNNFKLYTDKAVNKTFKTTDYCNMRSLLLGSDESVLNVYEGELLFDKFNLYLLKERGSNKGAQVRYSKNLKDLTHEITYDRLYNGVYPYYHQETTTQDTSTTTDGFKQVYIVGSKPYQDGWVSYSPDGEPYHPVDESPVQIASDGSYKDKVYCWNTKTQRFVEKIYNESCTLIDSLGSLLKTEETPTWIKIDWTGLPRIVCLANVNGYFKLISETEWVYHKKGEVVFDNSIKDAATNIMIYYSEVVPTSSTSEVQETTSVTHVELDDKIIWLDTPAAKEMKYDRILALNLTTEFDETPDKDKLEAKAKEYIEKNKIGQYKYNTTVSFVDISATTDGIDFKNVEKIELGDTIKVVYDDLGVDVDLRVITTTYDVLLNRYEKVELGEKSEKMSSESVQTGDNVSSLTNDIGYTDVNTVNKLIAKIITADYIKAKNAELSKAQIEQLQTARIKCTGLLEATQLELDTLVAKMLTADNAIIKQTLEAGEVKVKGDISIIKGEISISNTESGTVFKVDRNGNVIANSVEITGGELNINDMFSVTPEGIMSAKGAQVSGDIRIESGSIILGDKFSVTEEGVLVATGATIKGKIEADEGIIGGFTVDSNKLYSGNTGSRVILTPSLTAELFGVISGKWSILSGVSFTTDQDVTTYTDAKFGVTVNGDLYSKSAHITGGQLNINNNFIVASDGKVIIKSGSLNIADTFKVSDAGVVTINKGSIDINDGAFSVDSQGNLISSSATITGGSIDIKNAGTTIFKVASDGTVTISKGSIDINNGVFSVNSQGALTASSVNITGGILHIGSTGSTISEFGVDSNGKLTATGAEILGKITALEGYIGDQTNGFKINSKSIESIPNASTTYNRVYVGSDAIYLGRNTSVTKVANFNMVSGAHTHVNLSITNENIVGAPFKLTYTSSASVSSRIIVIQAYSDSGYSNPVGDSFVLTIEPNTTEYPESLVFDGPYIDIYSYDTTTNLNGTLTLQQLPGIALTADGQLVAINADIKGKIRTQNGEIGGFTIDSNSIHNGIIGQDGSVLVSIGTTSQYTIAGQTKSGWAFTAGSKFGVDKNGNLYASAAEITGKITATSGKIGDLNITNNQLYYSDIFSIYPANPYVSGLEYLMYSYSARISKLNVCRKTYSGNNGSRYVLLADGSDACIKVIGGTYIQSTYYEEQLGYISTDRIDDIPTIELDSFPAKNVNPYIFIRRNKPISANRWYKNDGAGAGHRITNLDNMFDTIWTIIPIEVENGSNANDNNLKIYRNGNDWNIFNSSGYDILVDVVIIGIPKYS